MGATEGFSSADEFEDFFDAVADRNLLEVEVAGARGGDERGAVRAFVETQAGGAEGAAQALGEAQREPLFLAACMIEQRGQRGIDRGGLRVAGHGSDVDELEVGRCMVFGEVAFDSGKVVELFRIFAGQRIILGGLGSFGPPLFDDLRIAFHLETRAEGFEIHAGKTLAVEFTQLAFEVVVVGRSEQDAGHPANGDHGEVALGRFGFDGLGAVEFVALFAQKMAHGGFAVQPHAVVDVDDPERPFGLLGRRGQVDGVGRGIAQEDAGDVEKAEGLAGMTDLLDDGFHGGRSGGEGDAQPGERVGRGRGGLTVVAARSVELLAVRPGSVTARAAALSAGFAAAGEAAAFRGTGLAEFARRGRGGRGVLGPGGTEVEGAEIQRRGFVGHGKRRRAGADGNYSVMMSLYVMPDGIMGRTCSV